MKISKTSQLILSAGIFIVVLASLGLTRSQQVREWGQLDSELGIAEKRLENLQVKELRQQQEALQGRLDESKIQLTAAKDKLHQTVESISVTDEFFAMARSCNVAVQSISSLGVKSEKLKNIACSVITLNAVVEGDVSNLINFVIKLNSDFTTGVVKTAQMTMPKTADDRRPSASILLVIYTYEGD